MRSYIGYGVLGRAWPWIEGISAAEAKGLISGSCLLTVLPATGAKSPTLKQALDYISSCSPWHPTINSASVLVTAAPAAKSLQSYPTVQPHKWQATRLLCLWDSPGKNTGAGCHFLLQCMKVKSESESLSRAWLLVTPWTGAYQAPHSEKLNE